LAACLIRSRDRLNLSISPPGRPALALFFSDRNCSSAEDHLPRPRLQRRSCFSSWKLRVVQIRGSM